MAAVTPQLAIDAETDTPSARRAFARRVPRSLARLLGLWACIGLVGLAPELRAQAEPSRGIYVCIDARGKRLTSDRPVPECAHRDQQLLNRDGSVRAVISPVPTADERAEREAQVRKAQEARAAQNDAVRRDRNLVARFPDAAAHMRAREASLDPVRVATKHTEQRIAELSKARLPLMNEAEFYKGKNLPTGLKVQIDANDAALAAQRDIIKSHQGETDRINQLYDAELQRLRRLWSGAAPGSLGPAPQVAGTPASGAAGLAVAATPPEAKPTKP